MTYRTIFTTAVSRNSALCAGLLSVAAMLPMRADAQQPAAEAPMEAIGAQLATVGIGEHRGFAGAMLRAVNEDGSTIVMLLTRRDPSDETPPEIGVEELRQRLQAGGLLNVDAVDAAGFVVVELDPRTAVIVMPADLLAHPVDTRATMPPPPPGAPDLRELPGAGFDTVPSPPGVGETLR
jgi:hypothetical protein